MKRNVIALVLFIIVLALPVFGVPTPIPFVYELLSAAIVAVATGMRKNNIFTKIGFYASIAGFICALPDVVFYLFSLLKIDASNWPLMYFTFVFSMVPPLCIVLAGVMFLISLFFKNKPTEVLPQYNSNNQSN